MGIINQNGIYRYDEVDDEATFSDLLNLLGKSVSDKLTTTDWIPLTNIAAGWTTPTGSPPAAKIHNGMVLFRGVIANNSFSGGFTRFADLPPGIPAPSDSYRTAASDMNSDVTARVRASLTGTLEMYRTSAQTTWMNISALSYPAEAI